MSGGSGQPGLARELGLRDVVLLYAVAAVSLQWLSTAAQTGPASLMLWLLALLAYFVPSGLAVMELSSRYDGEGGLYIWIKQAFGEGHGFVAAWCYVVSNLVFFPTLLLFVAGCAGHVAALAWPGIGESLLFQAAVSLGVLWLVVGVNIVGLKVAKRLTNACALAMGMVLCLLVGAALLCAVRWGSATTFAGQLVPDLSEPLLVKSFATMMFALVGLELAPLMGSEIRESHRVIPRAIIIAGALIASFYLLGTLALLVALPAQHIGSIAGIPEAVTAVAERLDLAPWGVAVTALMVLASIGVLAAWVAASVRLPYVVGIERQLPAALGRLHPRWHTPHVALLASGVITSALVLLALAGASVGDAYQVLVDMTVTLTFIPIAYMFAALAVLRWRASGTGPAGVMLVPGGRLGLVLVCGSGLLSTLVAIGCALAPPTDGDIRLFYAKVLGGCVAFLGLGLVLRACQGRQIVQQRFLLAPQPVDLDRNRRNSISTTG